jgi:hypothetical protein
MGRVQVLGEGRLDLRVLPLDASVEDASLDQRPADFPQPSHQPPLPERFTLGNGIPVDLVSRPRSGLFQGALVVEGGERVVSAAQAGLASLTATMLTAGAGGRSAAELADAIDSLGARVRASASEHETTVTVRGLASRLSPTLDLFADAVLRPNLLADDFERERNLAVEDIRSRAEDPRTVAFLSSSSLSLIETTLRPASRGLPRHRRRTDPGRRAAAAPAHRPRARSLRVCRRGRASR